MTQRREVVFGNADNDRSGVQLCLTRQGIEYNAWYDTFVGVSGGGFLSWDQVDKARLELNARIPRKKKEAE